MQQLAYIYFVFDKVFIAGKTSLSGKENGSTSSVLFSSPHGLIPETWTISPGSSGLGTFRWGLEGGVQQQSIERSERGEQFISKLCYKLMQGCSR